MDPKLFKAATEGNIDVLQYVSQLDTQLTPNGNTALHIAALFGKKLCVIELIRNCPSLLCRTNIKGETSLHIAASEGHVEIARVLIEWAKAAGTQGNSKAREMMRMTNEDGDTALHQAVRNGRLGVVNILTEEDPDFSHPINKAEETPLYLAVERGWEECVSEILRTCTSASPGGPNGRTALHAAVIFNLEECVVKLLNWKADLCKKADLYGWTPLHYAARLGHVERLKQLLAFDTSLTYLTAEEDGKNTALHVAASRGNVHIMEAFMSFCPDCFEMVNSRGQNIIHIAVENRRYQIIEFCLENTSPFIDRLINQKDSDGNMPLHLLAASGPFTSLAQRLFYEEQLSGLLSYPRADTMAFNNENKTPRDICDENFVEYSVGIIPSLRFQEYVGLRNLISRDRYEAAKEAEVRSESVGNVKKAVDTSLIVATLIATVTFAAGFTLPGGYQGYDDGPNQGMAILTRKSAFKAFVITDTLAMMLSSCAVFIYFFEEVVKTDPTLVRPLNTVANLFLIYAQGSMMIAFITGLYAVLAQSSALAISACVLGCLFLSVYWTLAGWTFELLPIAFFRVVTNRGGDTWRRGDPPEIGGANCSRLKCRGGFMCYWGKCRVRFRI